MKIGFIGVGNMGGAILRGLLNDRKKNQYSVVGRDYDKTKKIANELNVEPFEKIADLVSASGVFFVGVKPNKFQDVLPEIATNYCNDKICISMAAGISIKYIEEYLGKDSKIIRIMPNTPALVGEGMISVSRNENITDEEIAFVLDLMSAIGKAEFVDESLIHAVIGVSGSSPAYTYMYINALSKSAVAGGIDEKSARIFAAQAVLGAAKMVLETEEDLDTLVDNVCSPGGTTIEAVNLLKNENFMELVFRGAQAAVDKSKKMDS